MNDENGKGGFERNAETDAVSGGLGAFRFKKPAVTGFESPSAKFQRIAAERDEISRAFTGSNDSGLHNRIKGAVSRKINWGFLRKISREWINNSKNLALLVWITCVAIASAILFLLMSGMLNHALPRKSQRDAWHEVDSQILNGLFTLMCLYQHPQRIYHLVLIFRWRSQDIVKLRKLYSKNGTYKPHEWVNMLVLIIYLNLNCFAQYGLCGLYWGYKRSVRPAIGIGICSAFSTGAPAIAGLYYILSPLGKEYDVEEDEEAQTDVVDGPKNIRRKTVEKTFFFVSRDEQRVVEVPQWSGGILDIWGDIPLTCFSLFCGFCVFGWNMERLGFGNMYVHIAVFMLLCTAPFWIFNLTAVTIDNEILRRGLSITGIVLCAFGLLYGGFWRIQMRKRFNLPPSRFQPGVTDCALWICCCFCSLAQEVRTGNSYDNLEDRFYMKRMEETDHDNDSLEESSTGKDETVTPPVQLQIQR